MGNSQRSRQSSCAVKYEGQLHDGSVVSQSEELEFVVGDGYFCPALRKAVITMKKKEKVLSTVKPQYADGFVEKCWPVCGREVDVTPSRKLVKNLMRHLLRVLLHLLVNSGNLGLTSAAYKLPKPQFKMGEIIFKDVVISHFTFTKTTSFLLLRGF